MFRGSADHTIRVWTLAGEYIGTLGTFRPWITLVPDVEWDTSGIPIIPADLKRNSSFTTMKVKPDSQLAIFRKISNLNCGNL